MFLFNSETVKFGHVTFFWNGNRSGYFDPSKEEYVEIPSDSGITFNVQPKMKALEISEKARDAILSRKFDQVKQYVLRRKSRILCLLSCTFSIFLQVRVNLPNGDMVGHTGDIEATIVACKAADEAVKVIRSVFFYVSVIAFDIRPTFGVGIPLHNVSLLLSSMVSLFSLLVDKKIPFVLRLLNSLKDGFVQVVH